MEHSLPGRNVRRAGQWCLDEPGALDAGPAIVSGDVHALWLYFLAPVVGASLGALTHQLIRSEPTGSAELMESDRANEYGYP